VMEETESQAGVVAGKWLSAYKRRLSPPTTGLCENRVFFTLFGCSCVA
jgi:hypothetical protein